MITKEEYEAYVNPDPNMTLQDFDNLEKKVIDRISEVWLEIGKQYKEELPFIHLPEDITISDYEGFVYCGYLEGFHQDYNDSDVLDALEKLDYTHREGFPVLYLYAEDWKELIKEKFIQEEKVIQEYVDKRNEQIKNSKETRLKIIESLKEKLNDDEIQFVCTNLSESEKKALKN